MLFDKRRCFCLQMHLMLCKEIVYNWTSKIKKGTGREIVKVTLLSIIFFFLKCKYERELGYNWLPLIFKGQSMINIYVVLLNSVVFLMKRKTECLFMRNVQIV